MTDIAVTSALLCCVLLGAVGLAHGVMFSGYPTSSQLHRNDDGFSSLISISTNFQFFGTSYNRLYVSIYLVL